MKSPVEKKRKFYAFWGQFNEKPSIIPSCPGEKPSIVPGCPGTSRHVWMCHVTSLSRFIKTKLCFWCNNMLSVPWSSDDNKPVVFGDMRLETYRHRQMDRTQSPFQCRNVCFNSHLSSLHWKCNLRSVWGQVKMQFYIGDMFQVNTDKQSCMHSSWHTKVFTDRWQQTEPIPAASSRVIAAKQWQANELSCAQCEWHDDQSALLALVFLALLLTSSGSSQQAVYIRMHHHPTLIAMKPHLS